MKSHNTESEAPKRNLTIDIVARDITPDTRSVSSSVSLCLAVHMISIVTGC